MSTVDYTIFDGTQTGPELAVDLYEQFQNTDTELDARPKSAVAATISAEWTFTAAPVMVSSNGVAEAITRWKQGTVEGGHTTEHEIRVFASADGIDIAFRPYIDGVATPAKEFRFEFDNENWAFEGDLVVEGALHVGGGLITGGAQTLDLSTFEWGSNAIWHAGNFNPSSKSDTSHNHSLSGLSDVNTTGRADTNILQWDEGTSKYIHVTKPTGGGSTNISIARAASSVDVKSDTGTDGTISAATTSLAGVMTAADKTAHDSVVSQAVRHGNFAANGLMIRTAAGNYTNRSIAAGNEMSVSNGDGVSGNPTIAFSRNIGSGTGAPSGGSDGDLHFRHD